MLRDLLRGATIPPIVLYDGINGERPQIVDGLQQAGPFTKCVGDVNV